MTDTDITTLDAQALFTAAANLPEQVEHATRTARNLEGLPDRERVENVVILGMGANGVAGDIVSAVASPLLPVPVATVKSYELPAFVGEGSLVFALSFSGDTEEVIETATDAAVQGAKVVVVSGGGQLAELAGSWGAPLVRVPKAVPLSRAAVGAMAIPPLTVLEDMGLFPGGSQWIDESITQLERRRDELTKPGNFAERLAERLAGHLVLVAAAGRLGGAAAGRWKASLGLNAKAPAIASVLPDACHDEIEGWDTLTDVTHGALGVVELRHDEEHPQVIRRFDLVHEHIAHRVDFIEQVRAEGDGTLAQLLDLVMIGDFVSLNLAVHEKADLSATPFWDYLQNAMGEN